MTYAKGSRAIALCDRCGFQYKLNALKYQEIEGKVTSLKVCRFCYDVDNEQWMARLMDYTDNQSLRDPRPDTEPVPTFVILQWGPENNINFQPFTPLLWNP